MQRTFKFQIMNKELTEQQVLWRIRLLVLFFIGALIISGITAFPLESEIKVLISMFESLSTEDRVSELNQWLLYVYDGVATTNKSYPFMAYGTDWLAFAHIIIAIAFIGVFFKPVRNIWIVYWAMIACIAVLPLAFICGSIRGIPLYWILIDCSFGIFGMIPLLILRRYINQLARISGCYVPTKY